MNSDLFRTIPNPYIVGNPIRDPRMFFGREDDFAYVKNKFTGGKDGGLLVLCGARRSGKTSILFQIMLGRLGEEFVPVMIDMQAMAARDDRDLLEKTARRVASALEDYRILSVEIISGAEDPFSAFEAFMRQSLASIGRKTLVLMFDEYELFETHIDSGTITTDILNLMASLIEHNRVFIVFTGSDNLEARNKPYWHLFLSKALHRKISFLSRNDALRLIEEPVKGLVEYDSPVPEKIFQLTAGQPFYTQVICQSIVDRLNECRRSKVGLEDVDIVASEVIENPLPQMIFNWNSLADLEKMALAVIAEIDGEAGDAVSAEDIRSAFRNKKLGYELDSSELSKALENLFHSDILQKSPDGQTYTFKMALWRLWVGRMHSTWQVIHEMENGGEGPGLGITKVRKHKRLAPVLIAVIVIGTISAVAAWSQFGPRSSARQATAGGGMLSVRSIPSGASVFRGSDFLGTTPLEQAGVPAGRAELRILLPGYRSAADTIEIGENERRSLDFDLAELTGGLSVDSDPPGASIRIDGRATGTVTPAVLSDLSANSMHRIDLELPGREKKTVEAVRIYPDSVVALSVPLGEVTGRLTFVSHPSGAEIRLDGVLVGTTPRLESGISYGKHSVAISLDGHARWEAVVNLASDNQEVVAELPVLPPGYLICNVNPYGDIYVDGHPVGERAHFERIYPPGSYEVMFKHPQFGEYRDTVVVASGDSVSVTHRFGPGGKP